MTSSSETILPGGGVDQEHPAGLQPALGHDVGGRDVEHADLAGQDDEVVLGLPPAAGAQAVAVEDGADQRAVGEADGGRAVPRLHDRGVEPVEGPAGRVHLVVVLPRLRDHHQDGVRQRPAGQVQQLEHLVEGRRVAEVAGGHREDPVQAQLGRRPGGAVEQLGGELRLAGPHPVPVALDGVDLAVVRDEPERVGQRPAREGVGGEPAVHQRDRRLVALVAQVGEELRQLVGGQHALVGDRPGRQRGDVERAAGVDRGPLGPLAQHEGRAAPAGSRRWATTLPPKAVASARAAMVSATNSCAKSGMTARAVGPRSAPSGSTGTSRQPRTVRPSSSASLATSSIAGGALGLVGRQEGDADGVLPHRRQVEVDLGAQQGVGDLGEDAGAVTGVRLGAGGAAVVEVVQRGEALGHDRAASAGRGRRPRRRRRRRPCRSPGRRAGASPGTAENGTRAAEAAGAGGRTCHSRRRRPAAAPEEARTGAGPGPVVEGGEDGSAAASRCGGASGPARARAHRAVTAGLSSAGRRWPGSDGATRPGSPAGLLRRVHSRNTGLTPINRRTGASAGSPVREPYGPAANASAGVGRAVIISSPAAHRAAARRDRPVSPLPGARGGSPRAVGRACAMR